MARSGMAALIQQVRLLADVGTAEWTQVETYWSDDHIEAELDKTRQWMVETVSPVEVSVDGTPEYHDYLLTYGNLEEAASGTEAWMVRDLTGALQGTANYSVNYEAGQVTFTADTDGEQMRIYYRTYDLYATAASIWRARAGNVASYYNIKEGEHSLSRSEWFQHCMVMAELSDSMARIRVSRMDRSDING